MRTPLTPLERQIASEIARQAQSEPAAVAVWVFGSRARGASTEDSDLDVAVQFAAAQTQPLREWLESVRRAAEEPVVDQWLVFVNLVGLYADDIDPRLAQRVRAEGEVVWQRERPAQD
jgi:predicted nucleotidyltransferase